MRKLVFFAFIFSILLFTLFNQEASSEVQYEVIPDDAIRLRILANSDTEADQQVKHLVRDEVSEQISGWVKHISDIDEARQLIERRIPEVKATVAHVLETEDQGEEVDVTYGKDVTFPIKLYDNQLYPAGEYEAVLITIGAGNGSNWWCVLFPPLCFLDFSNGTHVAEADTDNLEKEIEADEEAKPIKIKFFLFELFGWT